MPATGPTDPRTRRPIDKTMQPLTPAALPVQPELTRHSLDGDSYPRNVLEHGIDHDGLIDAE